MKKFISLLAAMALSFASVTAFAANAVDSDVIYVNLAADKATIAPGESVTVSAYISANGTADVSFDTLAMFGLIFDMDNFTYEVTKTGDFTVEDYSDGYGLLWAMDETGMSYVADTACVEVKFTANADAAEATYDFSLSDADIDTGFQHGQLKPFFVRNNNVKLTGVSVEVKAAQPEPEDKVIVTENNDGTYSVSGEEATLPADAKILIYKDELVDDVTALTEASRFVATYDNADSKAYNIYAAVNAEGEGTLNGKTIAFAIIYTDDLDASKFTFDIK